MIKKYRKKPVVIEAVLWDGTEKCLTEEIFPFIGDMNNLPDDGIYKDKGVGFSPMEGLLAIPTLEGVMDAHAGDYIIKGVKSEFYPCKPDIFEMTYEEVI